jgi:oxygen-independent coproporphyrinogen-3 oxidase
VLLKACRSSFRIVEPAEVTIEINPATATLSDLIGFRTAGVNRASLGIQSLEDRELHLMGRAHTENDGLIAFEDLRSAGFDNVSVDLIAGFPGQSIASLRATLDQVVALKPDHVSIYLLELKDGTRLAEQVAQGRLHPADDDLAARMYELFCDMLVAAGYEHYEISNFAIPGRQSRHNLKYWTDCMYLGIGAGAHGMTGRRRYANMENPSLYRAALQRGDFPFADVVEMTPETRFKDALIMGLRLVTGVNLADLGRAYAVDARSFIEDTVGDLRAAGLLALDGDRVFLTSRGRLLSNVVFSRWV